MSIRRTGCCYRGRILVYACYLVVVRRGSIVRHTLRTTLRRACDGALADRVGQFPSENMEQGYAVKTTKQAHGRAKAQPDVRSGGGATAPRRRAICDLASDLRTAVLRVHTGYSSTSLASDGCVSYTGPYAFLMRSGCTVGAIFPSTPGIM